MSITNNNLYPPIIESAMPAFVRTQACKVYFSLSGYNSESEIKNVQFSLISQQTNTSALKTSLYPSGIKITELKRDAAIAGDYQYYIEIAPSDVVGDIFEIDQYYKVQLRFTSILAEDPPSDGSSLATWIYNNLDKFSEWSTICLIKSIEQPHISINNLEENTTVTLDKPLTEIVGKMYFLENADKEKEYLKSYRITIQSESEDFLINSEDIYTNPNAVNEINYILKYELTENTPYNLYFTYVTNNLYTETLTFPFEISLMPNHPLDIVFDIAPQEEYGRIKILTIFPQGEIDNKITLKRSSSRDNFNIWENVKTFSRLGGLEYVWYDTTIESGVWYKYRMVKDSSALVMSEYPYPVICVFDDMFLTQGDKQLKIKFNPSISDMKFNVSESQQMTLGAQFPFVRRNGNNLYRTFNISGLISSFMNETYWYDPAFYDNVFNNIYDVEKFTDKTELYGEAEELYNIYNSENGINEYQDYIYEREFRNMVCEFLYRNDVKLYRSSTEGNILVKLMNISLQPVNELGRRLYSFSATAVEIDKNEVDKYQKYNIVNTYYYYCSNYSFTKTFESYESIIDECKRDLQSHIGRLNEPCDIYQLVITTNYDNVVLDLKRHGDFEFTKYLIQDNFIDIGMEEKIAIKDGYFEGAKLSPDQYTIIPDEYDSLDKIENPVEGNVYFVPAYVIDNYIYYDNYRERLLTSYPYTYTSNKDYGLYLNKNYNMYIYYNENWYSFDASGVAGIPIEATITYYFKIRGK